MNYTITKRLHEAKFKFRPNNPVECGYVLPDDVHMTLTVNPLHLPNDAIRTPTFAELNAALGTDLTKLYRAEREGQAVWVAKCCDKDGHRAYGSDYLEAMARLWLAVNSNKHDIV